MTPRSVAKRSRLVPYIASVRSVSLCGASQSSSSSHSSWETLRSCRSCPSRAAPLLQPVHQSIGVGLWASTTLHSNTSTRMGSELGE
eukprot:3502320-Alexandrium_andersonii.AAC.1